MTIKKVSNQITITEHKKIITIKEWYLATSKNTDVTTETSGWTESVQTIDSTNKYLWNYEEVVYSIGEPDVSDPIIIGVYSVGENGKGISNIENYYNTTVTPDNLPTAWETFVPQLTPENKYLWNYEKIIYTDGSSQETDPAIIGVYGDSGTDAVDFQIYSTDGFEFSDNIKSITLDTAAFKSGNKIGSHLSYQWYYKNVGDETFSKASIRSRTYSVEMNSTRAGRQLYCVITDENGNSVTTDTVIIGMTPCITQQPADVVVADGEQARISVIAEGNGLTYQWYVTETGNDTVFVKSGVGTGDSYQPTMSKRVSGRKAYCVVTDENGNSTTTNTVTLSMSGAVRIVKQPSSVSVLNGNKAKVSVVAEGDGLTYQWYVTESANDTEFVESVGTSNTYSPIMNADISGRKAYCVITDKNGISVRSDTVTLCLTTSLTILEQPKSVTVQEGEMARVTVSMSGDGVYQWKCWNHDHGQYEDITGAIFESLTADLSKYYVFGELKCEMTYDGITYSDHVSLTEKTTIYTAVVKFFDGDNTIESDDTNSIIYVELYKDNEKIEGLDDNAKEVYIYEDNKISGDYISTDITGSNGEKKYFVCENSSKTHYDVVLGQYSTDSRKWVLIKNNYIYENTFNDSTYPLIYVPKEKVVRSLNIDFTVRDSNNNALAITTTRLMDLNDPIISSSEPANPKQGQMWLDTSTDPYILKMRYGSTWVDSNYQKGNVVYTSKPTSYIKGDLWILASGETCGDFGEGCMLRTNATSTSFNSSHWEDVDEEATAQKKNINQYFDFNKDTGLKVGQADDKFYVNISSSEMGFYDAEDGTPEKVVSIGNKSATIKDMTVEDGATFNCDVQFGNFILKTESNGSLSLALAT